MQRKGFCLNDIAALLLLAALFMASFGCAENIGALMERLRRAGCEANIVQG